MQYPVFPLLFTDFLGGLFLLSGRKEFVFVVRSLRDDKNMRSCSALSIFKSICNSSFPSNFKFHFLHTYSLSGWLIACKKACMRCGKMKSEIKDSRSTKFSSTIAALREEIKQRHRWEPTWKSLPDLCESKGKNSLRISSPIAWYSLCQSNDLM